ncbi:class I SAM-dependent DNA methyltransferase [Rubellimicrobium roseum]|uniref:site-specific DNA-methyltransferase (adenine-specific) n=1 Tax=Rubellimicrobium roseum TaxID=687525 RepID=A0A5C4NL85_9RHOB|nr:DNA methyltransferase [Rubellimicrobium roseum]TNC74148.1 class I SAM-dependent DNA methyltransferase [Rubellimicrobium roseum]
MEANKFIAQWVGAGGTERQNSQSFLLDLCELLGVDRPSSHTQGDYVFERPVVHEERGIRTTRFIDLYHRGRFILESKQSSLRIKRGPPDPDQPDLGLDASEAQAPRGTAEWDRLMGRAFLQAKGYVADLPSDHPAPPFLILVDVGHVIELYADFSGQGRNYTQFPDRNSFQITMDRLRDPEMRKTLCLVWQDPAALNPARRAAEVTRDVAERLARVAARLETRQNPGEVAGFLMRCLFTMFAEDTALLPKDSFRSLLRDLLDRPHDFVPALESLWANMDRGHYDGSLGAKLRRFNGGLFRDNTALPLDREGIAELSIAASRDWRDVEPAIFGTLLERALDPRERSRLGAHYTPRAYVERLVVATVIDPLREDWDDAQATISERVKGGDEAGALAEARAFHHKLCTTRVLDPACGTGNFLYVTLELMKRLEGEVLERIEGLGGQDSLKLSGETVDPSQFLGLETNPRAAAIAEVVLWVGYLKWQLRTGGLSAIPDPVLEAHRSIEQRDAVLAWDDRRPRLGPDAAPLTAWDRITMKPHPVTGLPVPDGDARVAAYDYVKPRRADWPEAEFIVGNPPFIGGKDMRAELGDGYAEALWRARPEVPGGADFVMQWWDEAARRLADTKGRLRRFGFITTNSITQTFSRRVVERHLGGKEPLSLAFAVADHPWVKGADRANVRIAMTVMRRGKREGVLGRVIEQSDLDSDAPVVRLGLGRGTISARLALGADVTAAEPLLSNEGLSSPGVKLHGAGFIVTPAQARALGLGTVPGLERHIRPYLNGRDLAQRSRGAMVIDLHGLTAEQVRDRFPSVYEHVTDHVRPHREENKRDSYRDKWWAFGEPRADLRAFTQALPRFIVTVETTRHRLFRFLPTGTLPDNMLVTVGLSDAVALALLSSRVHVGWAIAAGGWLGVGNDPRYSKTKTFDPFPLPTLLTDPMPDGHAAALRDRLRDIGERLEAFRSERLAALPQLTLTDLYNLLERCREAFNGGPHLSDEEREDHARAHISILAELHDDLDRAALGAWGWDELAPALVGRPGATLPSDLKSPEQEEAENELLARLVALNAERRAEEARGQVRWLRPAYQAPRLGAKVPGAEQQREMEVPLPANLPDSRAWPDEPRHQFSEVRVLLEEAVVALSPEDVARAFKGRLTPKRRERVREVLTIMADLGIARRAEGAGLFAARR